jgi:hypothetical protein
MLKRSRFKSRALTPVFFIIFFIASVNAGSQQTFTLSYAWNQGQKFMYSIYIVGQVSTGEAVNPVRIRFSDVWEVLEEDKVNGKYKMAETNTEYSGADLDLRTFGLPPKAERIERMLDSYGRVESVAHYTEASRYYLMPLVFPEVPVREGGRWKLERGLLAPVFGREVVADAVIIYKFEEISRNYKGRRKDCARISVDAKYLYESEDKDYGVAGRFQGKIIFNLADRKLVDYQISESRREWVRSENREQTTSIQVTSIEKY